MRQKRRKAAKRGRPKGAATKEQKIIAVAIMPYYGSNAFGFKGLPCKVEREANESWQSFIGRYLAKQAGFPSRTWIKFKYETKIVQHYAVGY